MTRLIFYLLMLITCGITTLCTAEEATTTNNKATITWTSNYEEALTLAKTGNKPVVLFFTGTDWCGWCNKLEEEVFDTKEFAELVGKKFIFVKLDFPLYKSLPANINTQNKQLQKKFGVRSFPTLVMLDPTSEQPIGTTGYRPGGGKQYASHLERLANNFFAYKQKVTSLHSQKLSKPELRKLYEKSKELDLEQDTIYILNIGMQSEDKNFFLTEKYRLLANEGQIHSKEAVALKQQLQNLDPNNDQHFQYEMAVIEFEAFSEEMHKEHYAPDLAVAPLVHYINKFGSTDKENLWRLEMIISQVYLDKDKLSNALTHAQAAYDAAPSNIQTEIAAAIKSIQSQLTAAR